MAYRTYKTSDGAPTGDERKFRGTESKENFKVSGSEVVNDVITAVKNEFGAVTLENIKLKLRSEAALADTDKTIPALTGSGVFTTASVQLKDKFAAYTRGDQTFGAPVKTEKAVAATKGASSSTVVTTEKAKKK